MCAYRFFSIKTTAFCRIWLFALVVVCLKAKMLTNFQKPITTLLSMTSQ